MSTSIPFQYLESIPLNLTSGVYTQDDYLSLPEGEPVELLRGNLVMSPAPRVDHQHIIAELYTTLRKCAVMTNALALFAPVDVRLANDTILQPDLIYLSDRQRGIGKARIEGAPDIVIEVLSPGQQNRDRKHKLSIYAEHGAPEYWIVDPIARDIDFLVLRDSQYSVCLPDGDVYTSSQLPEVTINVAEFWRSVGELPGA